MFDLGGYGETGLVGFWEGFVLLNLPIDLGVDIALLLVTFFLGVGDYCLTCELWGDFLCWFWWLLGWE